MVLKTNDPRSPDTTDIDVGRFVRVERMARGLSQTDLANKIGVTFQQVQKYENGNNRISMGRLTRIAKVFDVNVTYLLGGSRETSPARLRIKDQAKLAEATRMLGRIGALRLLRAFTALPTKPPGLRESILHVVEGAAVAAHRKGVDRSGARSPSGKRNAKHGRR
jgi:transcriptional regulator with XRE-family HTH domain